MPAAGPVVVLVTDVVPVATGLVTITGKLVVPVADENVVVVLVELVETVLLTDVVNEVVAVVGVRTVT